MDMDMGWPLTQFRTTVYIKMNGICVQTWLILNQAVSRDVFFNAGKYFLPSCPPGLSCSLLLPSRKRWLSKLVIVCFIVLFLVISNLFTVYFFSLQKGAGYLGDTCQMSLSQHEGCSWKGISFIQLLGTDKIVASHNVLFYIIVKNRTEDFTRKGKKSAQWSSCLIAGHLRNVRNLLHWWGERSRLVCTLGIQWAPGVWERTAEVKGCWNGFTDCQPGARNVRSLTSYSPMCLWERVCNEKDQNTLFVLLDSNL